MQDILTIDDPLYDDEQARQYLNLKNRKTFAVWRSRRNCPQPIPTYIGRSVRYKKSSLDKFINERTPKVAPAVA
jgi:hypothetical protein